MSKAITGAVELGGAIAMGGYLALTPELLLTPYYLKVMYGLGLMGLASEAGAVADLIAQNRGTNITTRQPAAYRQIIYGEQRVGGNLIYQSTTGSKHDQNNNVIVLAGHTIDGIVNLYLDGRLVYFKPSAGQTTCPGGYTFGGAANGTKYYDTGNVSYNFGGLVFATAYYGYQTAAGGADGSLHANDKTWAAGPNGTPYGGGCAWAYFKYEYDTAMFSQQPELRWTVRGRNQIWDPRTGTTGYTANWALCVADFLCDPEFGFGLARAEINQAQLIAAANLCDEAVPLANGRTEPRYTFNSHWDTSKAPGDALQEMLSAAGGNLVFSAGQWFLYPAAAFTPSFHFTDADLLEDIQWQPYRSARDLVNRVRGTFTAPNYPYAPTGNLYNANGHDPDGYSQNNFNYAWQPTSYPEYAQDNLHGYPSDFFLAQDGGVELVGQLNLPATISVATAQRLAKIKLMLNRQQGSGTFAMSLSAWRMMPMDVFTFDYVPYGWVGKQMQVTSLSLAMDESGDVPRLYVQVQAREFDPNNYAWSAAEELSILDVPNYALQHEAEVGVPASMTLNSGAGFDVVNGDGVLVPRVQVEWTDPLDVLVTGIEVQYLPAGGGNWVSCGIVPVGIEFTFILGLKAGQVISVQIRSWRASGAFSAFLRIDGYTVSATSLSTITSSGLLPGIPFNLANNATLDSLPYSGRTDVVYLRVYGPGGPGAPFSVFTGQAAILFSSAQMTATPSTSGYLVITNLTGGRLYTQTGTQFGTYTFTPNYIDTLSDAAILIGSCTTCTSSGSGGVSGGGGAGGNGSGGSRGAACTVEHTELDTPDGPVNNILLKHRLDAGHKVYLMGRDGPEQLVRAHWVWVHRHQKLTVGDAVIECSNTHTVSVAGVHKHCAEVPSGTLIDTRTGPQEMTREVVDTTVRVLELTLAGPSHEYSASGVLTHNYLKYANPN